MSAFAIIVIAFLALLFLPVVWTPMLHPARPTLWRDHGLAGRAMTLWDACAPHAARWTDAVCAATRAEAEIRM